MRPVLRVIVFAGVLLTILFGLDQARSVVAGEATKTSHSKRGGILVATEGYQFEVFFYPTGVRVFPLDATGHTVDTSKLTAGAIVYYPGVPPDRSVSQSLHPDSTDKGATPSSLVLSIGLADAPEKTTTVAFEIQGLSGPTASTAAFKIPLEFVAKASTPITYRRGYSNIPSESELRENESVASDGNRLDFVSGPRTSPQPAEATPSYAGAVPTSVGARTTSGIDTSRNATTTGFMYRDWTTGRTNLPISKPWLPNRN